MIKIKSVSGPASYAGGGFTVVFGEFEKITSVPLVQCSSDDILGVADTQYGVRASVGNTPATQNIVTIVVTSASTVGAGPNAWAEVGALDLHLLTFTVTADGE